MSATLDITPLRSLAGVATYGGFHRAAHALHLTQAAVSRHVQRLEDALGEELVEREGRSVRFTAAGERLLTYAFEILDAHDRAVAEFSAHSATLTVGAMDHVADELLPELMTDIRKHAPDATLRVRLGRSAQLRDAFTHGQIDIALVLDRLAVSADEPGAVRTRWIASEDWTRDNSAPLALVLFDHQCGLRLSALETLRQHRIAYSIVAETPDLAGMHAAVRAGLGVALLPCIGRLPDRTRVLADLPDAASVLVSLRTGPAVSLQLAQDIRKSLPNYISSP